MRFIMVLSVLMCAQISITAAITLPKNTKKYLDIFGKHDPEFVFNNEKRLFKEQEFKIMYTKLFTKIDSHPELIRTMNFQKFVSLLSAVVAFYRYHDDVLWQVTLFSQLKIIEEIHRGANKLNVAATVFFEEIFPKSTADSFKNLLRYLEIENDLILLSDILKFISWARTEIAYPTDPHAEPFEQTITAFGEVARERLRLMNKKQFALGMEGHAQLQELANSINSALYSQGSRFQIAGASLVEEKSAIDHAILEELSEKQNLMNIDETL